MTAPSKAASSQSSTRRAPLPLYETSSQFRHWRYSPSTLEQLRDQLNTTAVARLKQLQQEERAQPLPSSTITAPEMTSRSITPPELERIQYLTVHDELSLVSFYLEKIPQLSAAFRLPERVEASGMTYLKRFYLRNTCMDYHPKNVMLTSLFLATKTENHLISIDTFAGKIKTTPEEILSLEFIVSQSLRFEYKIHHASLAGEGLSLDLDASPETSARAMAHLRTARSTDVEFIYTPSQIALAAFYLVQPDLVKDYLVAKLSLLSASTAASILSETAMDVDIIPTLDAAQVAETEAIMGLLKTISTIITTKQSSPVDKELVREIDARLRWARNPEKDPKSYLFQKLQREMEMKALEKTTAKAKARPTYGGLAADGDVFN